MMKANRNLVFAAAFASVFSLAGSASATTQVWDTSESSNIVWPGTFGMDVRVNSDVTVSALGGYTNGSSTVDITVYQLTSTSTGTEIASVAISAAPTSGKYAFVELATPITLIAGQYYQFAESGYTTSNEPYDPDQTNGPQVSFNSLGGALTPWGAYYSGSPNVIASQYDYLTSTYGAATFLAAVPEPSTWLLILTGFGAMGASRRFRRREVSARAVA